MIFSTGSAFQSACQHRGPETGSPPPPGTLHQLPLPTFEKCPGKMTLAPSVRFYQPRVKSQPCNFPFKSCRSREAGQAWVGGGDRGKKEKKNRGERETGKVFSEENAGFVPNPDVRSCFNKTPRGLREEAYLALLMDQVSLGPTPPRSGRILWATP